MLLRPSSRLCQPPASGWPQSPPSTTETASWRVRSTAPVSCQAVPGEPVCAPRPPAADDSPNTLRFSATHEPAEAAPPADEVSPSDRCPLLIPHTALVTGTLHRPQRRTRRLSTGESALFCRSGYPSCTTSGPYAPRAGAGPRLQVYLEVLLGKSLAVRAAGQLGYQCATGVGK